MPLPVAGRAHEIKLSDTALLSLRTKEKPEALRRWTEARAALHRFYDGVRLGEVTLDFKQAMALARSQFDVFTEMAESESGEPRIWEELQRLNAGVRETPEKMERWYGETIKQLLEKHGLTVNDPASRNVLLRTVATVSEMAAARGLKRAQGDFSDDGADAKFPPAWMMHRRDKESISARSINGNDLVAVSAMLKWERRARADSL